MEEITIEVKIYKEGAFQEFSDLDSYERWQVIEMLEKRKQELIKKHQSLW